MNKWLRALLCAVPALAIAAVHAYLYFALGLGRQLNDVLRALLATGALLALSAPFLALHRVWYGGPIALGVSGMMAFGLFVATWLFYAPRAQERTDRLHQLRQVNAAQLARAHIKAPCANGDMAFIIREPSPSTDGERMLLYVTARANDKRPTLLAVADGQFREPPRADAVASWVSRTGTTCSNERYASIDAMFALLKAHYAVERARLEKDFP